MAKRKFLVDIDLSQNQLTNAKIHSLATAPSSPTEGQVYFNTGSKILYVFDGSGWVDTTQQNSNSATVLSTGSVSSSSYGITSDGATNDVVIAQASTTKAGVMSAAKFNEVVANNAKVSDVNHNVTTNLSEGTATTTTVVIESSDGADATLASASASRAGLLSKAKFDEITANTAKVSDVNHNVSTNLSATHNASTVVINSSDGANGTINAATATTAGIMSEAIFDQHVINNAKVSNVDHPLVQTAVPAGAVFTDTETTTSLSLSANVLSYVDELGATTSHDLSLYLDDSNLARLTSGSLNSSTGLATFTRDDSSTFTIDMSAFLDAITLNNTLTSTSTTQGLTANMGKVLKGLIDALSSANTGDEVPATTSVKGIVELATQAEVDAGTDTSRVVTPKTLRDHLGETATLTPALRYSRSLTETTASIVVTHNINNSFVQVSVIEAASGHVVDCQVALTSVNSVTLTFNDAPSANEFYVIIVG